MTSCMILPPSSTSYSLWTKEQYVTQKIYSLFQVIFSDPVVITACEFLEQNASSICPAVKLVGYGVYACNNKLT